MLRSRWLWIALLAFNASAQTRLSLDEAISRAPAAAPARDIAQAELDASEARRDGALAGVGPKLHANYTQAKFDRAVEVPFGGQSLVLRPDELRQGSIELRQPLSGIFTALEAARAAKTAEEASALGVDVAKTSAVFQTAAAYLDAQEADELVRLAETSVAASASQSHDAEALSKSGRIIRGDLLKISIAAQDAKAQLARATAFRKKAHERLLLLVGMPLGTAVTLDPLAAVKQTPPPTAVSSRLDLKRAALDVKLAEEEARLTRSKYVPTVDAFVKWDRVYSEPTFGNPPFTRTYGVAASWEIWDGGSRIFASREAEAKIRKNTAALRDAQDKARLELDGLAADLTAAAESLDAARAAVDQAEEAYRLDTARFQTGLETATDLLLSEATRTKAKANYVTTLAQVSRLTLGLQKAAGETTPKL